MTAKADLEKTVKTKRALYDVIDQILSDTHWNFQWVSDHLIDSETGEVNEDMEAKIAAYETVYSTLKKLL